MRAVAHSTRQTIRLATVLAAAAALMLALAAPFAGTAHASASFAFAGFIELSNGDMIDVGDPDDPETWFYSTEHPQDVVFEGYALNSGTDGRFHLSCSTDLDGEEVTVLATQEVVTIVAFGIYRDNANNASAPLTHRCGDLYPTPDDEQDPDPLVTTLTLIKVVEGGEATFSDFTPVVTSGEDTLTFAFGSVDDAEATDVEPGTYTLGEQDAEGYDLASIVCDNEAETAEGESTLDVTLAEGDEVTCTFTNVASTTDDEIIEDEEEEIVEEEHETVVLDDVFTGDDDTTGGAVDSDTDVKADADVADELAATGLETVHLALLAALLAALGVLFLLGTETDKVSAYRA